MLTVLKYKYENILVSNCLYLLYIYLSDTQDDLFFDGIIFQLNLYLNDLFGKEGYPKIQLFSECSV